MKEIGASRRVDELGRIVIPKSIRTRYKIRQGDVFEIFVEDNKIVLQKEEIIDELCNTLYSLLSVMANTLKIDIVITDTDKCIYSSDKLKSYINKEISSDIIDMILNRKKMKLENYLFFGEYCNILMQPIIIRGDVVGSVIFIIKNSKITDILELMSNFIRELFVNKLEV